ncbi:MAG: SDR family NAD(P)-dependent oxidoreductase [Kiritimatiellae bacterium]|nr:SDR family NAD(P)-dependent oxidoreductase [Kiritimatiellia bacterium]
MHALSDNRIWVTGASSGIGQALAVALAKRGNTVIASGRNETRLQETRALCPNHIHCLPFDVASRQENKEAAHWIKREIGGLDIAVLNAGTCEYINVHAFDAEIVRRVMEINYFSLVYGVEAVLPMLRNANHPYLVGMSSTVAYTGLPRAEAYGSSKAAIRHFLQALRIDLAREKIAVSIICPGFVKTPLTDKNDFAMPFCISSDMAAAYIIRGMRKRKHEIAFPLRFMLLILTIANLPSRLRNRILVDTLTRHPDNQQRGKN